MIQKFELINTPLQSRGIVYINTQYVVSIANDENDSKNTTFIKMSNGSGYVVKGNIEDIKNKVFPEIKENN